MNLYIGKVIDNDSQNAPDSDPAKGKTGAVQLYIEFLMYGLKKADYIWFRPAQGGTGGSAEFGTSCIPEIDSIVWCFFEEENYNMLKKGFYLWNVNLKDTSPHSLYEENVKDTVGSESEYPDVKFLHLKNGINIAISSNEDTPEITIFHLNMYVFIDKDGYLNYKDGENNKLTFNGDGILIEDKNGNTLEMGSSSVKINNNLEILQ
jgi:hypothetical protein